MRKIIGIIGFYIIVILLFAAVTSCANISGDQSESVSASLTPSIVVEPNSYEEMQSNIATNNVGVLIFSIDDNGLVSFSDGSKCTIAVLISQLNYVVPAARVETLEQAVALADYLQESQSVEFFVVSSQSYLIDLVKEYWSTVRGIYDVSTRTFNDTNSGYDLAGEVCAAKSQVVILSSGVSRSLVTDIQARAILVWIFADSKNGIWDAALTGCYGIINSSASAVISVLEQLEGNVILRTPYLIGHRGYPEKYNENSGEGVEEAFRVGASHVEIDVHITADNEILVMHDSTIDRTTTGTGTIANMTLNEICQYQLDDNYLQAGYSEIPVLSDMLDILLEEEFSDKIIIIEIKDNSEELVTKISELLDMDKYSGVRDRLLFITFNENLLANLAEIMPDIPRGFLGTLSYDDFLVRLSPTNTFIDSDVSSEMVSSSSSEMLKDYGYAVWAWIYDYGSNISTVYATGVLGFATNYVGNYSDYVSNLYASESIEGNELKIEMNVSMLHYDGTISEVEGIWRYIDFDMGMFYYKFTDSNSGAVFTYYTELVIIENNSS